MATHPKKLEKKQEGKALGLTFWQCFARNRLYSTSVPGIKPYLYIIPFFLAYFVLDLSLRFTYRGAGIVGVKFLPASLFTLGWALVFAGLVFFLPKIPRWFVRCVPLVTFVVIAITHSGFMSAFRRFFSFSVLTYGGTGEFMDASYIKIDWKVIAFTHFHYFPVADTVIWETSQEDNRSKAYHELSDSTNALMVSGLYQYTVRDLVRQVFPANTMSNEERQQVDQYVAEYEAAQTDNEYTGLLAGKNVILVQLEAIDTWMLQEAYMPNLSKLKAESISFTNHYTPAYITAGTFNTEFMTNTGLLPATGGIATSVYGNNSFPYSLANLFGQQGYTARSFHNSEGNIYDRSNIHLNLGYEQYYGGTDLAMENYQMDRYLINGFDQMTEGNPFFSFVITLSGHGPYGEDNPSYQAHAEAAQAAAQRTDGNYVYAVAGAMETDQFIGELVDSLTQANLLEDTVLIFYADHYNYYMMDDALNMDIKGVDNMNMLQHTDFFIWSSDLEATQVDKVTSSVDVLPTIANLFGLDTSGAFLVGHDGLGDQGGYVFFSDGSWYDGETYWSSQGGGTGDPDRSAEITKLTTLSNWVLAGDYYRSQE